MTLLKPLKQFHFCLYGEIINSGKEGLAWTCTIHVIAIDGEAARRNIIYDFVTNPTRKLRSIELLKVEKCS